MPDADRTEPATAGPTLHYAGAAADDILGAVHYLPRPICRDEAVAWRVLGLDVVVRGDPEADTITVALEIEEAALSASGNRYGVEHHRRHRLAGPLSLPHYQPASRPPEGHTFYETSSRKAVAPS